MARLIDADEMIKGICFIIEDSKELLTSSVARKAMLGLVDRIKTVDAAPVVHANWTSHRTVEHDGEWYCSACGYEPTVFEGVPFCAKCGARMDGGDDG